MDLFSHSWLPFMYQYGFGILIFCGGLQADRLARKDGVKLREKVVGFRGDYYELNDHAKHKVRNPHNLHKY